MTAPIIARMRRADEAEVSRFLCQRPYENVFLQWLIENDRSGASRQRLFVCRSGDGTLRGAVHFGRQVVLDAQDPGAIAALANAAYAHRHERMIVARRAVAKEYWNAIKSWHAPPRLVRDRQPLLVVGRAELRSVSPAAVHTRLATAAELEIVMENSAAMIECELGYDPRRATSGFRSNVRRMIDRGMWWIASVQGRAAFFCHVGPHTQATIQLQGVWTMPHVRGQGIAKAALAQICAKLLEDYPTVSLYVNDFNNAALAVYNALGFTQTGELCTLLF